MKTHKRKVEFSLINVIKTLCCILCSVACIGAFAQASQDQDEIIEAANNLLISKLSSYDGTVHISFKQMDPRLKLTDCKNKLSAFLPPGSKLLGNTSVGVRCKGEKPWKLYLQATVKVLNKVMISTRYLPRGTILQDDDVVLEERNIATLTRGYITDINQLIGKMLKQPLQNNAIVPPGILAKPKLVHRGESVIILAKNKDIEIRVNGKAMMDGSEGELIKVKNISSQRVIEGRVSATGIVKIPM